MINYISQYNFFIYIMNFDDVIQEIYTIKKHDKTMNVISYLANIFKQYAKILGQTYFDNNISIIVGGAISDVIHGNYNNLPINIKDVDIATNMLPDDIEDSINWYNSSSLIGPKYYLLEDINNNSKPNGTINIYIDEESINPNMRKIEVTTFRSESGQRGTHMITPVGPFIPYNDALLIDCQRRDLTICIGFSVININSLDVFKSKLFGELDNHPLFTEAYQHIKNGLVTFVGNPYERIYEDTNRLLRFIRKSSKKYHNPNLEHFDICIKLAEGLHKPYSINISDSLVNIKPISKERILHSQDGEIIKLLRLDKSEQIIRYIYERVKIMKLENIHNLYLPTKSNFNWFNLNHYDNDLIDINKLLPYIRFASLYLNCDKNDKGLNMLANIDSSIMGNNQTIIFYIISMYKYTQSNKITFTKREIYSYIINLKDMLNYYSIFLEYEKLNKVPNKLSLYHDALCLFNYWSTKKYSDFTITVNECFMKINEIKKSIYTNKSIDKKDKQITCKLLIQQLID